MYPVSYLGFVATSLQNNVTMVVVHNVLLLPFSVSGNDQCLLTVNLLM